MKFTPIRSGRKLPLIDTARVVALDDRLQSLDRILTSCGYTRNPDARPHVTGGGFVTVRVVWRNRSKKKSAVATYQESLSIPRADLVVGP